MVEDPSNSGSLRRYTAWAWSFASISLALLAAGGFVFKDAVYGAPPLWSAAVGLWVAIAAWVLGFFAGACALQIVYGFGVVAQSKSGIVILAALGIVLNALVIGLLFLLYLGLKGIGR
jgi:hypothetical protein